MRCPACGFENVADASFCGECATPLTSSISCPSCGRTNITKQKFCNGCGQPLTRSADRATSADPRSYTPKHIAEKILQSKSALEGERKQVTVLFADVKGSMDLAEQLDPEEWHKILDRFFQILNGGVHRFEGTVNQYTATASWRCSERRSRTSTMPSAPATRRCTFRASSPATRPT